MTRTEVAEKAEGEGLTAHTEGKGRKEEAAGH